MRSYEINSARNRRRIRQRALGVVSFIGICSCALFFMVFAFAYDAHAPWQIQACFAGASFVGFCVAVGALIHGCESP
jgi:hypothetical protein